MDMTKDVRIRVATAADKEDILNIADVYSGADYLQALFEDVFINCTQTIPYVAVYHDEIIGFLAAFKVDDGRTVISRAARVKEQFTGKGVFTMLNQHLIKMSSASVNAMTMFNTDEALNSNSFQRDYNLVFSTPFLSYSFNVSNEFRLCPVEESEEDMSALSPVTEDLLEVFFTSEKHRDYLFHGGRMIVEWVAYKSLPSNIPAILIREKYSLRVSDVHSINGHVKGLMSFSTTYFGPTGMYVYHLSLFGIDSCSTERHILSHMRFLRSQAKGEVMLHVVHHPSLAESGLSAIIEKCVLKKPWASRCMCIFERSIDRT